MVKPITPEEVVTAEREALPDEVVTEFNRLIKYNWSGGRAVVNFKDVALKIAEALHISVDEVYHRHYLDVEDIYSKAGWRVRFDHPARDEFVFYK